MDDQVIDSVTCTIEWAKDRLMNPEVEWEDAAALACEFREWLDNDEIDLLYLDKFDSMLYTLEVEIQTSTAVTPLVVQS